MKDIAFLVAFSTAAFTFVEGHAADTNLPPRLTVELRDGSRVVGDCMEDIFKLHSALLGDLKLSVKDIRLIEITATNAAKLTTVNGDALTVTFLDPNVPVKTSFGKVELATDSMRKMNVSNDNSVRHALQFNLNNRVEIPNHPALQFGNSPFAISFWLKTDSERPLMSFISKRGNSMGDGWVIHQDHGQLLFYTAGCASAKSQAVSIRDDKWHHFVVTRSGNFITFYLDGKNIGSGESQCSHYDNNPIRIGMDGDGDSWHYEGGISELHIYRRALDGAEVLEEWNGGAGRTQAVAGGGLIAGYHFDEGSGSMAKDFSGNDHNGVLVNNPQWSN